MQLGAYETSAVCVCVCVCVRVCDVNTQGAPSSRQKTKKNRERRLKVTWLRQLSILVII